MAHEAKLTKSSFNLSTSFMTTQSQYCSVKTAYCIVVREFWVSSGSTRTKLYWVYSSKKQQAHGDRKIIVEYALLRLRNPAVRFIQNTFSDTKSCRKPTLPPNAYLRPSQSQMEVFPNGARLYYLCNPGYWRSGFSIQRCENGKWTKATLRCRRKYFRIFQLREGSVYLEHWTVARQTIKWRNSISSRIGHFRVLAVQWSGDEITARERG